jgi:hypothetical protein
MAVEIETKQMLHKLDRVHDRTAGRLDLQRHFSGLFHDVPPIDPEELSYHWEAMRALCIVSGHSRVYMSEDWLKRHGYPARGT